MIDAIKAWWGRVRATFAKPAPEVPRALLAAAEIEPLHASANRTLEALESLGIHPGWRLLVERVKAEQMCEVFAALDARSLDALAERRGHARGMQDVVEMVEIVLADGTHRPGMWVQELREQANAPE